MLGTDVTRVLFDAHQLGRRQTGNETYVRELLRHLAPMPALDITTAVEAGAPMPSEALGVRRLPVPRNGFGRLGVLALAAHRRDVDLVHSMYFMPPGTGRPSVVTIHDISFESHPEFFSCLALARTRLLVRASAQAATRVVTGSEFTKQDLATRYGIPDDRVVVIPYGVGPHFRPLADREPYDGQRPFRVFAAGSLEPRKNIFRLLDALAILAADLPIELRVAGPRGYQGAAIAARVRRGLTARALGWVSDEELQREYQTADVFAFPSLYEGFGLPVLEAMACGTPVVASSAASLPEVAGGAALLVNPLDVQAIATAIRRIADDPGLARKLTSQGILRAREFSWRKGAERHADLYRSVTDG